MRSLSFFLNSDGSMPVLRLKYLLNVFLHGSSKRAASLVLTLMKLLRKNRNVKYVIFEILCIFAA